MAHMVLTCVHLLHSSTILEFSLSLSNHTHISSLEHLLQPLDPNIFDGSNYTYWCEQLILRLMAMNLMHVTKGKPEQYTPEEGSAFDAIDNLFRGCIISVLLKI